MRRKPEGTQTSAGLKWSFLHLCHGSVSHPLPKIVQFHQAYDRGRDQGLAGRVWRSFLLVGLGVLFGLFATSSPCAEEASDPILNLLLQKGIVSEEEVQKARAEAERIR